MSDTYAEAPRHPVPFMRDNPEWQSVRLERERLYLRDRARRYPARKPSLIERFATCLRSVGW